MAHKKKHTAKEINDQVAADALRGAGGFGPAPTHPSMEQTEQNPDATDADPDDDDDDDNDFSGQGQSQ